MGYMEEVLTDEPEGYWRCNEPSGTTAIDSSGNGHHGTYNSSVTFGLDSPVMGGSSVMFSGGSHVSLPTLPASSPWSLELWFKPLSNAFMGLARGSNGFHFYRSETNPYFWVASHMANAYDNGVGNWAHLLITDYGDRVDVHLDGDRKAYYGRNADPVALIEFGREGSIYAGHCQMAEVAWYSHALSEERAFAHYSAQTPVELTGAYLGATELTGMYLGGQAVTKEILTVPSVAH